MEVTAEEMRTHLDHLAVSKLVLKPCPICPDHKTPTIYRTRHTKKWAMRPGFSGCHHSDQKIFSGFAETPEVLADGWNFWVEENTP